MFRYTFGVRRKTNGSVGCDMKRALCDRMNAGGGVGAGTGPHIERQASILAPVRGGKRRRGRQAREDFRTLIGTTAGAGGSPSDHERVVF